MVKPKDLEIEINKYEKINSNTSIEKDYMKNKNIVSSDSDSLFGTINEKFNKVENNNITSEDINKNKKY